MTPNSFIKTHGLGNDYIVLDRANLNFELTDNAVIRICDEHFGIGSDGILLKVPSAIADFGLLIYNPDGTKAENCGNGLRIYSKYLYDYGFTKEKSFTVDIMGRMIHAEILETKAEKVSKVRVEMGQANFKSDEIPLSYEKEEYVNTTTTVGEKNFSMTCVSMGNPHCVVLKDQLDIEELMTYGPQIQALSLFPSGTNVQFARVISRSQVEIRIYERGAGYTLASGSSSCGVAAAMVKNGLVDRDVTIKMPGGELKIHVAEDWNITMTGPVRQICEGVLCHELIEDKEN